MRSRSLVAVCVLGALLARPVESVEHDQGLLEHLAAVFESGAVAIGVVDVGGGATADEYGGVFAADTRSGL